MNFEKKASYEYEDLIACGEGRLFGEGNAQLPLPNMLMIDKIDEISTTGGKYNNGFIKATLNIKPDLWFFGCHFKGDPVMPGCLGLDALWQLLGFYLAWSGNKGRGRALGCGEVKFTGQVLDTTKKIEYLVNIKRTFNKDLVLGLADGELYADGKQIYSAAGLKVGLFVG